MGLGLGLELWFRHVVSGDAAPARIRDRNWVMNRVGVRVRVEVTLWVD